MSTDTPNKLTPAELVEAVDAWLVANAGAPRRAAFDEIANRTGRTSNGVAQSYYAAMRRARGSALPKARGTRRAAATTPRMSAKPSAAIQSLTEHIVALERELAELRAFRASVVAVIGTK
jgi:hypothetical protein